MATNMIGTCRSPHAGPGANGSDATRSHEKRRNDTVITAKAKKKSKKSASEESLVAYFCAQICEHQLGISINLLLLLALTHSFFPRARRRTTTFFSLSYYNSQTDQYGCGTDDLPYVALWLVIFTGLRVAVMEYILGPIAKWCGIKTKKGLERFKEQAWLVCYCVCSWSLGMYITYNSEFWFNVHGLWRGWPFREISGLSKFYYLFQSAFWLQQILVVNIEERRKDYHEMFTHHIFTCALLFLSYGYYHTRVGIVILCLMDLVDIVLPTAKLLKYAGYSNLCDVFFGLFVVTWLVTRQVLFPIVLWSIYKHTPTDMQPGCYFPDGRLVPSNETTEYESLGGNLVWSNLVKSYTDREGPVCWNPTIRYSFLTLLTALQVLIFLWFAMIIKVVYKVLSGKGADDVRSDDEGADEEEDVDEKVEEELERVVNHPMNAAKAGVEWAPVEQEVGVEALTFSKRRERSSRSSGSSRASGISIPGHADRKELLGRIGCDKPT